MIGWSDEFTDVLSAILAWQWHLSLHVWEDAGDGAEVSDD